MSCTFSVIIPTCNRNAYLREAMECVLEQTLSPYEILIVDNGAGSVAIPPFTDARCRVLRTVTAAGPGQARNVAATVAQGEYLAFLDDDDLWEAAYLEKMATHIKKSKPDMLLARVDELRHGQISPHRCPSDSLANVNLFRHNPGVIGSSIVTRRDAFLRAGGFDARLMIGEDKMLVAAFLRKGLSIRPAPDIQALYRAHEDTRLTNGEKMGHNFRLFAELLRPQMSLSDYWFIRKRASGILVESAPDLAHRLEHAVTGLCYAIARLCGK